MKKIYSIILLIAYLVGTLQPVIPMFDYQLNQGSVIEYVLFEMVKSHHSEMAAHQNVHPYDNSNKTKHKANNLVRDSFYPVGVAIFTAHAPVPFVNKKLLHLAENIQVSNPAYLPNSPPPKFS